MFVFILLLTLKLNMDKLIKVSTKYIYAYKAKT